MKILLKYTTIVLLFTSCAKLPVQTVDVITYIINEGNRMHALNVQLVNNLFNDKARQLDDVISNQYTPALLNKILSNVDSTDNPAEVIPLILTRVTPEIIAYRNNQQLQLENARAKILEKLNTDYNNYNLAAQELKRLINSHLKVNEQRQQLLNVLNGYTGNNLDLSALENNLNQFVQQGGAASQNIINLNNAVDTLLNNK